MSVNRREVIGSLVTSGFVVGHDATAGAATSSSRLFARTSLAKNQIAGLVERWDMPLPDVSILTEKGFEKLSGLVGKTRLIAVWAAWCTPCLMEIRDMAGLQSRFADDRFEIDLLATASGRAFGRKEALQRLRMFGAEAMPLFVEADGGSRSASELTTPLGAKGPTFPCTLLVDKYGKVRGRLFGAPVAAELNSEAQFRTNQPHTGIGADGKPLAITNIDRQTIASTSTAWSGKDGQVFLRALKNGILDQL